MYQAPELTFIPGLLVKEEFHDYKSLQQGAKNYMFMTKFRLGSGLFYGLHSGMQLNHMQLGHADRYEGIMYDGYTPKDCVTIGVLKSSLGSVSVNRVKMFESDIIVVDDTTPYAFVASERAVFAIISVEKHIIAKIAPQLLENINQVYKDRGHVFENCIDEIWDEVNSNSEHTYTADEIETIENRVLQTVEKLFQDLPVSTHALNAYEEIAFDIKDFILENLDEDFSIRSLTEQFSISDKTLENYFKALFGMTPKRLITILKLNQAHESLCHANPEHTSVTDIAMQWGFMHLSRFSHTYEDVFNTLPSDDLQNKNYILTHPPA